jgi:betaine-aldehyde dehydrogenase
MGPLTSQQHQERVLAFVDVARGQGGRVLTGGTAPQDASLANGYYVRPTVVEAAGPNDRVAQEEVFGPFVTVLRFRTDDEALAIANGTMYGLGSGLWTRDLSRAHRIAGQIDAGMCWINCYKRVNPGSPFGGVGQSGYGREMGFEAMHDYTEARSVWVNVDGQVPPHFRR